MIVLTKGEEQNVIFTGTENCLLTAPYFLFVFTNRITTDVVSFVVSNLSTTQRYDYFTLEVNDYFEDSETGFWTYDIYEQATNSGTSITGKHKVETGLMYLHPADTFTPIEYNEQDNSFKTYNG
jgi:hypothetical protein